MGECRTQLSPHQLSESGDKVLVGVDVELDGQVVDHFADAVPDCGFEPLSSSSSQ